MATTIEYALMAGHAYRTTRDEINWFPVPQGWTPFFPVPDPITPTFPTTDGFEAISFQNTANPNEIVISYAGTYDKDLTGDMLADAGLATGYGSAQLLQAAEYYLQVKATTNAHITLTGHSLGGGLAALIGVFFGVEAHTFDQAPFAKSAKDNLLPPDVAANLKADLLAQGYGEEALSGLTNYLQLRETNGGIPNSNLVTNIDVVGEFLSGFPWNIPDRIGTTVLDITHGATGVSGTELHAQALLTAFLLSSQGATSGNISSPPLNEISKKLPNMLQLIFDKDLFANDTDTDKRNFLEHLVRHQAGVPDPLAPGTFLTDPDDMLIHFTNDMQDIAAAGGIILTEADLNQALIAFGIQAYYLQDTAFTQEAFNPFPGGVHFDRALIPGALTDLKGYNQYFNPYLTAHFSGDTLGPMKDNLPNFQDWYLAGRASSAAAGTRAAFMLGADQVDRFQGSPQNDFLVGDLGADQLTGGAGNDWIISDYNDKFSAFQGSTTYTPGQGTTVYAGAGHDAVQGGFRHDWIDANTGHDQVMGLEGRDYINGGSGNDWLAGNRDDDILIGGPGRAGRPEFLRLVRKTAAAYRHRADCLENENPRKEAA